MAPKPPDPLFPGPRSPEATATPPRRFRSPPPAPPPRRRPTVLGFLFRWFLVLGIWVGIAVVCAVTYFAAGLPDISTVAQAERRPTVSLLAVDGTEFARYGDLHSDTVTIKELPPNLVNAVIAIEDRRFRYHFGVDPIGLARALYVNHRSGRATQGGSTITQQLAKNLFLSPEKSMRRKIQEALLALWLESHYSKDEILAAYLNRVYLGAGAYGVDAAARTYFGKPAREVNLWESAIIAGLLKAPSRYSPSANPDEARDRARVVLAAMVDAGFITDDERKTAGTSAETKAAHEENEGRYFADWVAGEVDEYVGHTHGDVIVQTTLDLRLQRSAEKHTEALLAGPGVAAKVGQAALVAMTPEGAVRALVGGRDYGASEFNRATQALRQPGSSFKPFIYLAGLEQGLTPDTPFEDTPVRIGDYAPGNYDNKYRGTLTMAQALAYSSNVATLRILDRTGVEHVRQLATAMGITSPLTHDLSLALGTSEVTLLDLTRGYAAIANHGIPIWPYAITEIRDHDGRILYQRNPGGGEPVADPALVQTLSTMMEGVVTFGTGKLAKLDRPVSAKSGTTQNYKDAWFMGFTSDLVTGVWLGNDDNSPMRKVTGGTLPARLWHDFMADVYAPAKTPARPVRPDAGIGALIEDLEGGG